MFNLLKRRIMRSFKLREQANRVTPRSEFFQYAGGHYSIRIFMPLSKYRGRYLVRQEQGKARPGGDIGAAWPHAKLSGRPF